ncbi:unnamed protein product [Calypogeia fissa]
MAMASSTLTPEGGGWAAIARKEAPVKVDAPLLKSTAGLKTLVVDANALIGGGVRLAGIADQFVTVQEVLNEVRDPASRFHLSTLPVTIRCLEPSAEALAAVIKFSRATGDFQSLSSVDLKLIALAYTIEAEVHGVANIRSEPPPLLVTPSSTRQKDPPGWGTVENPEEWEDIEENEPAGEVKTKSRILGLKSLNIDASPSDGAKGSPAAASSNGSKPDEVIDGRENDIADASEQAGGSNFPPPREDSQPSAVPEDHSTQVNEESVQHVDPEKVSKANPTVPEKNLVSPVGKLNVAEGLDASKGVEVGDEGWQRASCRSTRRNFLKREAKRVARKQEAERASSEVPYSVGDEQANVGAVEFSARSTDNAHLSNTCSTSDTDEVRKNVSFVDDAAGSCSEDEGNDPIDQTELSMLEACTEGRDNDASFVDDIASNCTDVPSYKSGDVESEDSWMVAPLWKSSVACMTADFAMQNVLLQMGLRLLSTNGMHIRELNKWVLKCQACNHVVSDVGRLFCPKCGNGGTLFKVAVTVGQNGTVHAGRAPRVNLRGTRYSLPMPKGGREGAALNPILREDQLPKVKKSGHVDRSVLSDVNFTTSRDKTAHKLAGVKTAAAVFGGRRNPNERRISGSR